MLYLLYNKRAQSALGRSPKEKVKGHGEAIYREPVISTPNIGRGPLDDVIHRI